jgi:hypothetical protein
VDAGAAADLDIQVITAPSLRLDLDHVIRERVKSGLQAAKARGVRMKAIVPSLDGIRRGAIAIAAACSGIPMPLVAQHHLSYGSTRSALTASEPATTVENTRTVAEMTTKSAGERIA